jgi:hypothetical protein
MPSGNINDPKHWRDRAAEMRVFADTMKETDTIAIMHRLADAAGSIGGCGEAAFGHSGTTPLALSLDSIGESAHGRFTPASEGHGVEAEAEHAHPILQSLTATFGIRRELWASHHVNIVLLRADQDFSIRFRGLAASAHLRAFAERECEIALTKDHDVHVWM